MISTHTSLWRLWRGAFACTYPGGCTLRLRRQVFILRWRGYVPAELEGWRLRLGRFELHVRRVG